MSKNICENEKGKWRWRTINTIENRCLSCSLASLLSSFIANALEKKSERKKSKYSQSLIMNDDFSFEPFGLLFSIHLFIVRFFEIKFQMRLIYEYFI
jgi:hypothetical protein